MGNQDGSPTAKDYQDTLVVSLSSLMEKPLVTQEGSPGFPGRGPPGFPGRCPPGLLGNPGGCPSGPPGPLPEVYLVLLEVVL